MPRIYTESQRTFAIEDNHGGVGHAIVVFPSLQTKAEADKFAIALRKFIEERFPDQLVHQLRNRP